MKTKIGDVVRSIEDMTKTFFGTMTPLMARKVVFPPFECDDISGFIAGKLFEDMLSCSQGLAASETLAQCVPRTHVLYK